MSILIGDVHKVSSREIKIVGHSRETTTLQEGDVVKIFDYLLKWDNSCVTEKTAREWRQLADPLCDEALQVVFPSSSSSVGQDLLGCVERYAAEHPDCDVVNAFLEEVSRTPPPDLQVTPQEVQLAQELFLDNSIEIVQALLHYSLAGGFASDESLSLFCPRIVRTLQAVSYLVPHSKKSTQSVHDNPASATSLSSKALERITASSNQRTFIRLLETFQFVLDVLDCSSIPAQPRVKDSQGLKGTDHASGELSVAYLMPGGEGWRSTVNVRLLHSVARMRARERWRREGKDTSETGVAPISQEELGATLAAFSTIPLWCLGRLGVPPSPEHASAYLSLWQHVGFYLGISTPILQDHFCDLTTSDKFIATTALHLFSVDDPADMADAPTIPILRAASDRAPTFTSFEYNCALTHYLLGPALAARVGLEAPRFSVRVKMYAALLVQRVPHWFALCYPRKGWATKRRAVMKEGIARSLMWNLGMRRVSFRPRTAVSSTSHDGELGDGGELAEGVKDAESVDTDPAGAMVLVKQWREVMLEMMVVSASVCLAGSALIWLGVRRILA